MRANTENKSMDMEVRDINMFLPAYIRSYLYVSKNESPDKIIFPMFPSVPHPYDPSKQIPIEYYPMDSPMVAEITEDGKDIKEATEAEIAEKDRQEDVIKELTAKVKELEATTEGREGVVGTAEQSDIVSLPSPLMVSPQDEESVLTVPLTPAPENLLRQQQEAEPTEVNMKEAKAKMVGVKPPTPEATTKPGLVPAREPKQPDVVVKPGEGNLDGMGSRDKRDQGRVAKDLAPEPEVDENKEVPFDKETGRDSKGKPTVKGK